MHIDVFDASYSALHCATQRGLGGGSVAVGAAPASPGEPGERVPEDADGSGAVKATAGVRGAHEAAIQLPKSDAVQQATALAAFVDIGMSVARAVDVRGPAPHTAPMAEPARRSATYDDLLALPENVTGEILDGELIVQPRPASPHAVAASILGVDLGGPFHRGRGGPGGWVILDEPELHLRDDVLVPDLAGWRRARMPVIPDAAAFDLAPDWVGEILSPTTARIDRVKKRPLYARERVRHLWLIDPSERTLEVFRLEGELYAVVATYEGDAPVRAEPFDAIELELGALWRR